MIYGMFQLDESKVLARDPGGAYITVGDLVQEIHHLRAEIERKDAAIKELLFYNRIANDLDEYLADVADWGLGEICVKPKSSKYGLGRKQVT